MSNEWYEVINGSVPITQGDLVFDCPLIGWGPDTLDLKSSGESEVLQSATITTAADVVVMTQACDLEYHKVPNVILCPNASLVDYQQLWHNKMEEIGQNPTQTAWRNHCDDICDGFVWNLMMLNSFAKSELNFNMDIRIVDFREVFTVPRTFLESLLAQRGRPRLRLLPPYREHLSQAFARFFMRVGLPISIQKSW